MLRWLKPALALFAALVLAGVLNTQQGQVPPLGRLLSPYQGFWLNGETAADFPAQQTLRLPGLHQTVRVRFDDRRVPHIFAENDHDLYYAQGYLTARDRLWQMEFMTRVAAGRISEVVGERALEYDRFQRRMGLPFGAENSLREMLKNDTTRLVLESYSAGVNAYISQLSPRTYPFEYKLLDYAPEPWAPLKSALLLKLMAWDLSGRSDDLRLSNILSKYGPAVTRDLFPDFPFRADPVVPEGTPLDFQPLPVPPAPPAPFAAAVSGLVPSREPDAELGSNNFALAGSRTASGKPLLANDPHLQLNLPSIWYQVQLNSPGQNVYGVTIPGAPAVIIGFNSDVAWGVTNVGGDVLDWYQLKFRDASRREYWHAGRWKPVRRVVERIAVRGHPDRLDTVLYTHHGPVVYDQNEKVFNAQTPVRHALRWTAHDAAGANEVLAFVKLNHARNYQDYDRALRTYASPAQNFIFASRQGDVAIRPNGRFPLKYAEQGKFILDGSDPRQDWPGWIPMSQTPRVLNPARGYVSSANQHSAGPGYPYYLGWDYAPWDRAHRINQQLSQMHRATADTLRVLQNDDLGLNAQLMLPWMLANLPAATAAGAPGTAPATAATTAPTASVAAARRLLARWNYHYGADAVAATVFELWYQELVHKLWKDDFGKQATGLEMRYPSRDRTNQLLLAEPRSPWLDDCRTAQRETAPDLLTTSLQFAMDSLTRKFGPLGPKWAWAHQKSTDINHLAQLPGFGHQDVWCGGSPSSVNATGPRNGPSWRMVVDLAPPVRAYGIFPGGQSGNPASAYYDDMLESWRTGRLDELVFLQAADENHPRLQAAWRLEK
ncbi:penicillin acylase family protein [Hymenobacter aerophilus]|uniref:penicillin acylase family protein n=1 Tax=Hymenobacter aerophilus TaxID=119644 RepID=UPI000360AE2F|nr:penicillin acylase family protein [Hymenobacter aerophilus]